MDLKYILSACYIVFGMMNTYCFLFQRTARKIRQYAIGTTEIGLERGMLPDWWNLLYFISFIRFVPLVWLLFVNWKFPFGLAVLIWILKIILPVDDYGNMQKLKSYLFRKRINGTFTEEDEKFEYWITLAEIEIESKS